MSEQTTITESRYAWLRYYVQRLVNWWRIERATTPKEMELYGFLDARDGEIAALREGLSASQERIEELYAEVESVEKERDQAKASAEVKVGALTEEIEVAAEMHQRILLRIKAESEAYAQRLPKELRD